MTQNIFNNISEIIPEEIIDTIIESDSIKIERIISKGHSSPENFWYDQDKSEWIIILKGNAAIEFEDKNIFELRKGDYLNIPAHQKHRVNRTDPQKETIWLAVYY
jgi:cupin 2 domain-containing protein